MHLGDRFGQMDNWEICDNRPLSLFLAVDLMLARSGIPVELRHLIEAYLYHTTNDNESLARAAHVWMTGNRETSLLYYGDISLWETGNVTDMTRLFATQDSRQASSAGGRFAPLKFSRNSNFDDYIGNWDVSQVRSMGHMFFGAWRFNQPLTYWDVSACENMQHMFDGATSFNQNIVPNPSWNFVIGPNHCDDTYNIARRKDCRKMFRRATKFLNGFSTLTSNWKVEDAEYLKGIFAQTLDEEALLELLAKQWNVEKSILISDE